MRKRLSWLGRWALFMASALPIHAADEQILPIGRSVIHLQLAAGLPLSRAEVINWVQRGAAAVSNYFGFFPVRQVVIDVRGGGDEPVSDGVTYGASRITVRLGDGARPRALRHDWILIHEMFHLAFPTLNRRHLWMMEGLSDYLEPIARARAGQMPAAAVWREFVQGMPRCLPAAHDRGLDGDDRHERIYWGGDLFWLLADVQIRVATHNQRSIDDAIKAILNEGGNGDAVWKIEDVIRAGDRATGTSVLRSVYDKLGRQPFDVDLDALWQSLGVVYKNGRVSFDDAAPWAKTRAAITGAR